MKAIIGILALIALQAPMKTCWAAEPLFSTSTGEVRRDDGTVWSISVTELERSARTSTLRIDHTGKLPSVGSSLFVACSVFKLARERGFRYVAQLEQSGTIQLGFLARIEDDPAKLGSAFAAPAVVRKYDAEFMAPICDAPVAPEPPTRLPPEGAAGTAGRK